MTLYERYQEQQEANAKVLALLTQVRANRCVQATSVAPKVEAAIRILENGKP